MAGNFFIKSALNGLVLDVQGGGNVPPGTPVIMWNQKSEENDNQLFYEDQATGTIRSKETQMCLEVQGDQLVVNQFRPGNQNQQWMFVGQHIQNRFQQDQVLDIADDNVNPGARVCTYNANGQANQCWSRVHIGPAGGYGATPYPASGGPGYPQGIPVGGGYQGAPPPVGLPLGGAVITGAPPAGSTVSPLSPVPHIGPYPPGVPPAATSPPGVDSPTYTGPVSPDYVHDDPNAKGFSPTAPPVEKMDRIAGYDNVTFDGAPLLPPTYEEATSRPEPDRETLKNVPVISEEQARDALLEFVAENCCYGKGAAEEMVFRGLESTSAFHYTLETYGEARMTSWKYEPYRGQPLDTVLNGPAPAPWQISVPYPAKFKDGVHRMEVPHTASVKPCHTCYGRGRMRCNRCVGRGQVICSSCSGSGGSTHMGDEHHGPHGFNDNMDDDGGYGSPHHGGHRHGGHHHGSHHHHHHHGGHHHGAHFEPCTWCNGTGRKRCTSCYGHGEVSCRTCQEAANLKCYIELRVTWRNHFEDFIVERTAAIPDKKIRKVSGQSAFEEENARVWPINHFPDQAINQASANLVQRHSTAFPSERILLQRHRVRIIPVTTATYEWKGKTSSFYVYGFEHKVYAPNYPQKCCCGCAIL